MDKPLAGKVAIVTGSGRGIGRAIALAFANEGAFVACAARNAAEIDGTITAILAGNGKGIACTCDVAAPGDMARVVQECVAAFGGVDILVANAGMAGLTRPIEDCDAEQWLHTVRINLHGMLLSAQAVIPAMKRRGGGKIITIGSGVGHRAVAGMSDYACSKAGTWMLTRVLSTELAPFGIDVNELLPGPVVTSLTAAEFATHQLAKPELSDEWFKQPEDVVPMALFLAAQPTPGPTGQSFAIMRRQV